MFLEGILWGIFGLILGSFTNVLILRHGVQTILGRSACPHCHSQLRWFELIPVISFLALRGKCRTCSAAISIQYPLVEILMAALVIGIGLAPAPLSIRILGIAIALLLLAITVYDLRHMLMPDRWVYLFCALAFIVGALTTPIQSGGIYFLVSGPLVALPLFLLWYMSKGAWMGFGDVKFALGIGWLLGPLSGYLALCLAFFSGALIGVFVLLPLQSVVKMAQRGGITHFRGRLKGFTMRSEVPFGPFLILGLCIVWFSALYDFPLAQHVGDFLSLN